MSNIFLKAEELRQQNIPAALCIVTDTRGSTPRKQGSKMIVFSDGTVYGTIGGGSVEKDVTAKAIEAIESGIPLKCSFNLEQDLHMHCGGMMEVFIEPITPLNKLYIFGAGHIGKALAGFAKALDFRVTLFDPRPGIFNDPAFDGFDYFNKDYFEAIEDAVFDQNTYLVIVTPQHISDEEILSVVARKTHAYAGMIGSTRKVALLRKRFLEENLLTTEELDAIDMPVGIRFNAQTPTEIAVSILAKLIDVRNTRS